MRQATAQLAEKLSGRLDVVLEVNTQETGAELFAQIGDGFFAFGDLKPSLQVLKQDSFEVKRQLFLPIGQN